MNNKLVEARNCVVYIVLYSHYVIQLCNLMVNNHINRNIIPPSYKVERKLVPIDELSFIFLPQCLCQFSYHLFLLSNSTLKKKKTN